MIQSAASAGRRSFAVQTLMVLGGSLLMALGARCTINVGTVPITLQTLALPVVVALLGTRRGTAAMLAYLAEGACGLPVFAGGAAGPLVLVGPTAGYLWAYPVAAYVVGMLFDRGLGASYAGRWIAIAIGTLVIFASGAAVLSLFVGWPAAFALGIAPFVIGDAVKVTLAAACRRLGVQPSSLPRP